MLHQLRHIHFKVDAVSLTSRSKKSTKPTSWNNWAVGFKSSVGTVNSRVFDLIELAKEEAPMKFISTSGEPRLCVCQGVGPKFIGSKQGPENDRIGHVHHWNLGVWVQGLHCLFDFSGPRDGLAFGLAFGLATTWFFGRVTLSSPFAFWQRTPLHTRRTKTTDSLTSSFRRCDSTPWHCSTSCKGTTTTHKTANKRTRESNAVLNLEPNGDTTCAVPQKSTGVMHAGSRQTDEDHNYTKKRVARRMIKCVKKVTASCHNKNRLEKNQNWTRHENDKACASSWTMILIIWNARRKWGPADPSGSNWRRPCAVVCVLWCVVVVVCVVRITDDTACHSRRAYDATNSGGRTPGSKLPASPPPLPRPDGRGTPGRVPVYTALKSLPITPCNCREIRSFLYVWTP